MHPPSTLFAPFTDRIRIDLLTKSDHIKTDDDVAKALGVHSVASAEQTHSNKTTIVRAPIKRAPGADGLVTDVKNLTLLVRMADCQVFVVYDAAKNVAGVLHAGWRGVVCGAIPAFFEVLQNEWHSDPIDIFVYAGPSLCTQCAEFSDPAKELPGIDPRFFQGRHVDLRGIANQQLADAGVLKSQIERSPDCVKCKSDTYWSYREGKADVVESGYRNILACTLL